MLQFRALLTYTPALTLIIDLKYLKLSILLCQLTTETFHWRPATNCCSSTWSPACVSCCSSSVQ